MTRYPDPHTGSDLGPNGGPDQPPKSPRWPLALFVIAALAITALTLLRLSGH